MKTYASITDLIQQEIAPVLATDDTLTPEQGDRIAREVCARLQAAGLVVWEDGWSESRGAYWLPAQGFRMVADEDDDGAAFWAIVAEVIEGHERPACPAWCRADYLDSDGVIVHRHETSDPDAPYLVRVEAYADAAPGVYVRDAHGDDLTPEEALAMADALVRAARLVEGVQS